MVVLEEEVFCCLYGDCVGVMWMIFFCECFYLYVDCFLVDIMMEVECVIFGFYD